MIHFAKNSVIIEAAVAVRLVEKRVEKNDMRLTRAKDYTLFL